MKLTLRDQFWLILVVALALAWWADSRWQNKLYLNERERRAEDVASLTAELNGVASKYTMLYQTLEKTERELQRNLATPGLQKPGEKREGTE
jgi:hypothetical protein